MAYTTLLSTAVLYVQTIIFSFNTYKLAHYLQMTHTLLLVTIIILKGIPQKQFNLCSIYMLSIVILTSEFKFSSAELTQFKDEICFAAIKCQIGYI